MTLLGGYQLNDNENIRNINSAYISGSIPSSQGNFGLITINYPSIFSETNIAGGSIIGTTGSTMYSAYLKSKTFYISAGSFASTKVKRSGMAVNIEASWGLDNEWYNIISYEISANTQQYYTNSEYHPYIRARISGLKSGATGSWMVNLTGIPY